MMAQNRRKTHPASNPLPTITLQQALAEYRFNEAEELLNAEIEELKRKKQDTEHLEEQLREVAKAKSKMIATEQVVFIDSLILPANEVFKGIFLSEECGKVFSYPDYFNREGSEESSVFLSQMGNQIYFSAPDADGQLTLYSSELLGTQWSAPEPLEGLSELEDTHQSYPFMLADGTTLYYAAQGSESMGGYDIFMTRYDADDHSFLTPENIGMPFNSPANDYLYIVDEFLNIGYFVTDRNQAADSVCIYTFIPNEARRIYNTSIYTTDQLRDYARINSIRQTWRTEDEAREALARLEEAKKSSDKQTDGTTGSRFIINNNTIYHSANDFRSEDSRKQYQWWMESKMQLQQLQERLETLRLQYAHANAGERDNLRSQILTLEEKERSLTATIHKQEKQIRTIENQN